MNDFIWNRPWSSAALKHPLSKITFTTTYPEKKKWQKNPQQMQSLKLGKKQTKKFQIDLFFFPLVTFIQVSPNQLQHQF